MTKTTFTHPHTIMRWGATAGGLVLSGLLATVAFGQAAPSTREMHHGPQASPAEEKGMMGSPCQEMMAAREKMMSDLAGMNATLGDLVTTMDAAQGEAKVAAMGAVVHELVAQRTRMVDMMSNMQPKMMAHMMGHMMGDMKGAKDAMAKCPMMKAMGGAPGTQKP